MTFNELINKTKDMDLEAMGVYLGKQASKIETLSCFQDGNEWVMQEVNDRQRVSEKRGSEEEIVRKVYGNIKIRSRLMK